MSSTTFSIHHTHACTCAHPSSNQLHELSTITMESGHCFCRMCSLDLHCKTPSPKGSLAVGAKCPSKRAKNEQQVNQWRCITPVYGCNAHASTSINGKTVHPTTQGVLIHAKQREAHSKAGHNLATSRRWTVARTLPLTHKLDNGCFSQWQPQPHQTQCTHDAAGSETQQKKRCGVDRSYTLLRHPHRVLSTAATQSLFVRANNGRENSASATTHTHTHTPTTWARK